MFNIGVGRWIAEATPADPLQWFAQLGASGVLIGVLWLQLRRAEERRDSMETLTISTLKEALPLLATSTKLLAEKYDQQPSDEALVDKLAERLESRFKGK